MPRMPIRSLHGRRVFADLADRGRTLRSGPLRVRYLAAPVDAHAVAATVGYAVGKKTGGAVARNRIRRRLRAAVSQGSMPLTSGSYLISADPSVLESPFADLVAAVDAVAARLSAEARP